MTSPAMRLSTLAIALISMFALAVTLPVAPASAATAKTCKVRNVTRGISYRSFPVAVKAARNGNKLTVKGACRGRAEVHSKRLTIVGVRTKRSGTPILRVTRKGRVLTLYGTSSNVTLRSLVIKGLPRVRLGWVGGAIKNNRGVLTLRDTFVKGFTTGARGAGIFNLRGTVRLKGTSSIRYNVAAGDGGGIYAEGGGTIILMDTSSIKHNATAIDGGGIRSEDGDIVLRDSSSITDNTATGDGDGGGIYTDYDSVTMEGSSSVARNSARYGGGIRFSGTLSMSATSSITGNTARIGGGGISAEPGTLVGVVCAPDAGANVYGNTPDDCRQ